MEGHASITSLLIVIMVAFLTPILLHRFKLNFIPVVVAEIIMGLIIGKTGFDLVQEDMWLETLSTLGFLFLMFLSGLEIDFSAFSMKKSNKNKSGSNKDEPNAFSISVIIFSGIFILSLVLSYLFVWLGFIDNALLMTLIISTISLGVVVPTLKEAHLMKTNIGQIILIIAVIADLVTMILLAVFVSIYDTEGGNTWLLLILFGAGVILYFGAKRFKNRKFVSALATGTTQIGTRAVFTLLIVLVAISETVGAENILGAFLAGVLVSLLAPDQELIHKLDSFGYGFFIPIFFVMIGVDLNLWALLSDYKMLLLIPLLLIALFISKIFPILLLKKWYDNKTVLASAFLLTSTLSLVIASAAIGERMGVISSEMSGTLILVAVISCVITPIFFKKLFPRKDGLEKKLKVALLGANQLSLPVIRELNSSLYESVLYHTRQDETNNKVSNSIFEIIEIDDYSPTTLEQHQIYEADIIVVTTGDENKNASIAREAKERGAERVIVRIETPSIESSLRQLDIEVFSSLMLSTTMLRALIETPGVINILSNKESSLYEIRMLNDQVDGMTLRRFPFTGDVIIVRILRGKDSIVPHGDTELCLNDRLIVTGSAEYVEELKRDLELGPWHTRE